MIKILPRSTKMRIVSLCSAATLATGALVGLNKLQPHLTQSERDLINQKEFVRNHSPKDFDRMQKSNASSIEWHKAVQALKDSLRNDSIARANYIKAAQNIRKSVK